MNYKITFHLDGRGVVYDPFYPVHLDSLIIYGSTFVMNKPETISREQTEFQEAKIPVKQKTFPGYINVYHASALIPDDDAVYEETRFFRKRFRLIEAMRMGFNKPVNNTTGFYRMYNSATQVFVCLKLSGYLVTEDPRTIKRCLEKITSIGSHRRQGYGNVIRFDMTPIKEDYSLHQDGICTRYIPHSSGLHTIRPRPPYWNVHETVKTLLPGCKYPYATSNPL